MNFIIYYQKWALNEYKKLNKSIKDILNMDSLQFYMPFYSLYFYIHNTAKAFKKKFLFKRGHRNH